MAKFNIIEHYLEQFKPEIMFVSEAEIKKGQNYMCFSVRGYTIEVSKTIEWGMARQVAYIKQNSS